MSAPVVTPFHWSVEEPVLVDLRERLARARLLPDTPGRPWSALGAEHLAELVRSWASFDWRAREAWLNAHPQVLIELGDVRVHAVRVRSERADAPALLVMHGWPHTFALQLDFADLLPDVHVVVASLPGFAFSSPYREGPFTEAHLADTMHRAMGALGYERYLTYGEDVSANVNDLIAATHPEAVLGIMVTHAHLPNAEERAELADPATDAFFARRAAERQDTGAYSALQSSRPDTLAAALEDSPVGLLAWLTEKLAEWSDTPRDRPWEVELRLSRERILTEAMIYWTTRTIAESFRPYFETAVDPERIPPVEVPAAVLIQRHEHDYPEAAARAFYRDLRVFDRLPEGGHFAIAEVPEAMAGHLRDFARSLELL